MPGQTYLKTVTFIGLWMNGTVCLLRSIQHAMLTSLKLMLLDLSQNCKYYYSFSEFFVIFFNFYEVICFHVGSRNSFTNYPYGFFFSFSTIIL